MVVVDKQADKAYEFYAAEKISSGWTTGWGGVVSLSGPGTPGEAVGTNMSRLAGLVRVEEIERGWIDHALVFSTSENCASGYRYPAHKTDGRDTGVDCIEAGSRVQLDPSINVDALNISPGAKMVARALQIFGGYVVDTGGAKMAFVFQAADDTPYCDVGLCGDYANLPLPWGSLRVLSDWDG